VVRGATPVGRAAGIEDLKAVAASFMQRDVGLAKDDRIRGREPAPQPLETADPSAGVVDDRQPAAADLQLALGRQGSHHLRIVDVPVHTDNLAVASELLEYGERRQIARVDDQVRCA
jgi:hypothetical protein